MKAKRKYTRKRSQAHTKYMREKWYPANTEKHLAAVRKSWLKRREKARAVALKAKTKCKYCAETHPACLCFHHRKPETKVISISTAVNAGWPVARILAEIAKCDVVCANCHRKIHAGVI